MTDLELRALDVALTGASDEEIGAILVRSVGYQSFNPQVQLTRRLAQRASPTHLHEALAHVAFALHRTQAIPPLEHLDVLDALLAAGARADHLPSAPVALPGLHALASCWGITPFDNPKKSLAKKIEKVVQRTDAVFDSAVRGAEHVDLVDGRGWSALHAAVSSARIGRVERLLAAGANPALQTPDGLDAVAIARRSSAVAIPAMLAALGAG